MKDVYTFVCIKNDNQERLQNATDLKDNKLVTK